MSDKKGLLSSGWGMVASNKRYILWFWLMNLTLAAFGTVAFSTSAHAILDHSMVADRLFHGFDLAVMIGLLAPPEFGSMAAMGRAAGYFSFLFFLFTALFLPGVFQGYASTYRLPREDFFRACGRNLWRFIRLMIIAGIVMGIFTGILFGINGAIVKKAGESTNEVLPFEIQMTGLAVIFLVMTVLRVWFDLAEADIVLNDQRAVRRSIGAGFRHTFRAFGRLLTSYVLTTISAAVILVGGLWVWMKLVGPEHWFDAFIVSQIILFLLLIPRFWQRGIAVSYWQQNMVVPVVTLPSPFFDPTPVVAVAVAPPSATPEGA